MPTGDLNDWLAEFSRENTVWYMKRLAANDTLATHAHQAGPYVPKDLLFEVFPMLGHPEHRNPDVGFNAYIDSHADHRLVRAIWYNNRLFGGTRNEARITNWGGAASALLDPESTGALAVFVFEKRTDGAAGDLHVWVCNHAIEEDLIEDRLGPIEPGTHAIWRPSTEASMQVMKPAATGALPCRLAPSDMPPGWLTTFPSGIDIVRKAVQRRPLGGSSADMRLIGRRDCEFEIFLSVEEAFELPLIAKGFGSVNEFVARAQTVLQRRKARSGRSLKLQTREIFVEEGLVEGSTFSHQAESEGGKRPDFLFPSVAAYKDPEFSSAHLRLLAAKTTCKDRWRQILNEADRIPVKHLLTLQEGVSETQFAEMKAASVKLVIPSPLIPKFPDSIQPELTTLEDFIAGVRHLRVVGS
jgi:hypothetical protein